MYPFCVSCHCDVLAPTHLSLVGFGGPAVVQDTVTLSTQVTTLLTEDQGLCPLRHRGCHREAVRDGVTRNLEHVQSDAVTIYH